MIGMKSIAVFGRLSGADRFKPIIKRADMSFLSANFDVRQPSVVSLGYAKNSMLMVVWHRFVFGVFLSINLAQVFYSVVGAIVVYMVNNVRQVTKNIKPSKSVGRKMSILNCYSVVASAYAASYFSSVSKVPSVIIFLNERASLPYKFASLGIVVKNGFKLGLRNIKCFHGSYCNP